MTNPSAAVGQGAVPVNDGKWLHRLYRSYYQSSGLRHWIWRRIRPAGIALGFAMLILMCMGVGHGRSAIYQLFCLGFAMAVVSFVGVLFRSCRLGARREIPRYGTVGQPLRYAVEVINHGSKPVGRAWLIESEPDSRPERDEFLAIKEPGEEERNAFDRRLMFFRWQWLLLRNRLFEENGCEREVRLKAGESMRVFLEITPLRRGVIRLRDLRAMLPDPFGVLQRCRPVDCATDTLMVLPRRYPLAPIELPGGVPYKISGEANTNSPGSSGEFVGLRDYRPEDPVRHIHWKSWARLGRPIVKELEDTHYPRYGLVLDCLSVDRTDVTFEEAVSVAASFASAIDTHDSLLDLMFVRDEAHRVTVGRGIERTERLMEVLAGVTPQRSGDLTGLARLVLKHRDDLTSCLVVLNGWDPLRVELLRLLNEGGVLCVPVIVGVGKRPDGAPGHWLESGHVAKDLATLGGRLI